MKPTHGKRSALYTPKEEKKTVARLFVELNTHNNISLKREYVYIEV